MKKYIYTIAAILLVSISCENTNENLVKERGVAVVPLMSDPAPAYFTDNIDASYVQFDLSLTNGETVDKASIEVSRGSKSAILKDVTLPAKGLKVTATEVLSALGISASDYHLGDVFNLYVLTTKGGKTTRSVAAFSITVVCYFDPSMLVGDFDWESDEDWDETGSATIVADPNDPYKVYLDGIPQSEGLVSNGNKIVLNVNPNNFKVSGPKSTIAAEAWGYHDYTYEPVAGSYSACDEAYTITFSITVREGSFGNFKFVFKKR